MHMRRIRQSLVTRLLLMGIFLIVGGAVVRYVTLTHFLRTDLTTVVAAQQEALASYVARDIDFRVLERQRMLTQLAHSLPPALLRHPDRLRAWLRDRYEEQPLFSVGLFVTDPAGRVVADFPAFPSREEANYADRDYVQQALQGHAIVGRAVLGRATHVPVLPMAAPIRDERGQVRAVIAGVSALGYAGFLDLLQQTRVGKTGGFLLVSPRDGIFIASSRPGMALTPLPPPGVNPLHDRAMAGYRGSGVTVNAQGVEEVSAMASVESTGWFVVARLPASEAFATVEHSRQFLLKESAAVGLTFLLAVAFTLALVLRPLVQAARYADAMTRGERALEPLPVVRHDEVGYLTEAFNRLLLKLQRSQTQLAWLAHHDALTELPNRALLAERTAQVLARAQRQRSRFALLFMDLDGFKPINDALGHEQGDAALRQVAARLGAVLREVDTLARVGGDEFVLLLADLDAGPNQAENAARVVAQKCLDAMLPILHLQGQSYQLGLSIGIALGDAQSHADAVMVAADTAMYEAKKGGRQRYVFAAPLAG